MSVRKPDAGAVRFTVFEQDGNGHVTPVVVSEQEWARGLAAIIASGHPFDGQLLWACPRCDGELTADLDRAIPLTEAPPRFWPRLHLCEPRGWRWIRAVLAGTGAACTLIPDLPAGILPAVQDEFGDR